MACVVKDTFLQLRCIPSWKSGDTSPETDQQTPAAEAAAAGPSARDSLWSIFEGDVLVYHVSNLVRWQRRRGFPTKPLS